MAASSLPPDLQTLTPYLSVSNAADAIDFYTRAFGARERFRLPGPGGEWIVHAEMDLGNSRFYLHDFPPEDERRARPFELSVTLHLYVEDVDAVFQQAVEAGAAVVSPVEDTYWGDRYGKVKDPFGHVWSIATPREDVSFEEMNRRAASLGESSES